MNRQRKVVITVTYNDLGTIIDTKAEELDSSTQPNLQPTCNNLATDLISRQAAIDAILAVTGNSSVRELYEHVQEHGLSEMWSGGVNAAIDIIIALPSAQPQRWETCFDCPLSNGCLKIRECTNEQAEQYASWIPDDCPLSAQPERLSNDDFETIRIHLSAAKERLCNQHRWKEAEEYQRIIDRFMAFSSAQLEIIRCKDCKWFGDIGCAINIVDASDRPTEMDFCSFAERRTDGSD